MNSKAYHVSESLHSQAGRYINKVTTMKALVKKIIYILILLAGVIVSFSLFMPATT